MSAASLDPDSPRTPDELADDPLEDLVAEVVVLRERGAQDALERACDAHPERAAELRARIARLDAVQGAFDELQAVSREHDAPRRFGRYTLVRELGRGGMGIVYLARDERLGREVALKAMTAPMLAGERGRKRFEREIQAVAALESPFIVPIYEAGEEHGAPYFTMQYVEGRTLSSALDELRGLGVEPARLSGSHFGRATSGEGEAAQPSRAVSDSGSRASGRPGSGSGTGAGRGTWSRGYLELVCRVALDLAEALEHAHEHGIVHRDVKPSNVLLRADGRAMLFDFGLARVETSRSMTRTGDFVGTPFYVSPEQVLSGKVEIDARTDVYALGVTLYELLTLRVPFEGSTNQEVFQKVVVKEAPPVRRLNPAVPRDLETICHTALAKDRDHRYSSAAEMAADLRRFLQFRPIVARPVGLGTRAMRWTRRNPAPAAAGALALLLVVGGPLTFGVYSHVARKALEREQAATKTQRDRADARAAEAELARTKAQEALVAAEQQRDRADRNVARVLRTIDEMLTRVAEDDLAHLPRMDLVRREFLDRALALHRELLAEEGEDPGLRRDTVRAQRRVADILYDLGRLDEAAQAARRAIEMQRPLVESSGGAAEDLEELATGLTLAGLIAESASDPLRPEVFLREAVELRERVAAAAPGDDAARSLLAEAHLNLGTIYLHRGRHRDAEREFRGSLYHWGELVERTPADAWLRLCQAEAMIDLGAVLIDGGRLEEAEHVGREALAVWRVLLDEHADRYDVRLGYLKATGSLADVLVQRGDVDEGLELLEETLRLGTALLEERPDAPEYAEALVAAHIISVRALAAEERPDEAIAAAEQALSMLTDLAARFPGMRTLRQRRAYLFERLAHVYQRLGRSQDELATREEAVRARREIVEIYPDSVVQQSRLGGALNNLGRAAADTGDPQRAAAVLSEAIEHQRIAYSAEPENPQYRTFLRNHLWGLAETSLASRDPDGAASAARQLPALDRHGGEEHRRAAGLLARCAALARNEATPSGEREASAAVWEAEALELLSAALERGASDLEDLSTAPDLAPLRAREGFAELLENARQ